MVGPGATSPCTYAIASPDRSPFVASYFAFEICYELKDHFIAGWGININYLKNRSIEILSEEFGKALKENKHLINERLFEKIFYHNNKKLVFPVEPFSMNRRYSLQQSVLSVREFRKFH